jgi:hypothetical protein
MLTLSYGGASFTYPNLSQHPLAFDAVDVRRGRAPESLQPSGLLLKPQADSLTDMFRAWKAVKLAEEAPERTGTVGAVVLVTARGPGYSGASAWTNRAAWFDSYEKPVQVGPYTRVGITLVDANQALAVALRELEEGEEQEEALGLGTLTFGGAVVNLTARAENIEGLGGLELSAAGVHVITGNLATVDTREVRGWVTAANLPTLETWVKTTRATPSPANNTWFPSGWSPPVARLKRNAGAVSIVYDVSFTATKIRAAA